MLGAFEVKAKPWVVEGIPGDFEFTSLPHDFDHFAPILEQATTRSRLETAGASLMDPRVSRRMIDICSEKSRA